MICKEKDEGDYEPRQNALTCCYYVSEMNIVNWQTEKEKKFKPSRSVIFSALTRVSIDWRRSAARLRSDCNFF